MTHRTPPLLRALTGLLLLTLAGCAAVPPEVEPTAPTAPQAVPSAEAAWQMERDGEFIAAAEAYLAIAATLEPTGRMHMQLHAANLLLRAAEIRRVTELLLGIDPPADDAELQLRYDLLLARISLAQQSPRRALLQLPPSLDPSLPEELRIEALQLRVTTLERLDEPLESAAIRVELDALLQGGDRHPNQIELLRSLSHVDPETLRTATATPPLAGWIELARLVAGPPLEGEQLRMLIGEWRAMQPDHPVLDIVLEWLAATYAAAPPPGQVALLLPASGPFATAAEAVRQGVLAAAYALPNPATVRIYRSDYDVWSAYQRAVDDGAEVVIGPLSKANVTTLARSATLPVPVLALNRADEGVPPATNLYQFALAPEAEVGELAELAWSEGYRRITLLYPDNDLGSRGADALAARWESMGGTLLDRRRYKAADHDFSEPLREMLELTGSDGRHSRLRRLLGRSIEFEARRRQDVDAVLLIAFPRQARQIRPQLEFHHAADLPLLATSHAYAPGSAADENRDLDGLLVCDMPWSFGAARGRAALAPQLDTAGVRHADGALGRLFALGADAYAVLPYLERLQADPEARVAGRTGILALDGDRVLQRQLLCARFVNGAPRLLGYTPDATPRPEPAADLDPEAIDALPDADVIPESVPGRGIAPVVDRTATPGE